MFTKRLKELGRLVAIATVLACIGAGSVSIATMDPISVGLVVTNYPNPFDSRNEFTTIAYSFSTEGTGRMLIYDLLGNLVKEYSLVSGENRVVWDGTNESGQKVSKGGYICVVELMTESNLVLATRKIGVIH